MAGNAGGILNGGGGKISGAPETDDIVTRSPLSMIRIGASAASKKPQCTVAGPASMRGTSCDLCKKDLRAKSDHTRQTTLSDFQENARACSWYVRPWPMSRSSTH